MARSTRRMNRSPNTMRAKSKLPVQPKVFKSTGRKNIKIRQGLLNGKFYKLKEKVTMPPMQAGCVGEVLKDTVVRISTQRTTPFGPLYFFDGFEQQDNKLQWIGEFDVLDINVIAQGCGDEVPQDSIASVLIPDAEGVMKDMIGKMVSENG